MPRRSVFSSTTVANTEVSPYWAKTVASACRAILPVSSTSLRPAHSISTRCVSNISYLVSHCAKHRLAALAAAQSRPIVPCRCDVGRSAGLTIGPLAADSQSLDNLLIAPLVARLHMVEKPAAQAHHLEQATSRMIVVLVQLEMLGQAVDALRQQRDLDLGRTGIVLLRCVFL